MNFQTVKYKDVHMDISYVWVFPTSLPLLKPKSNESQIYDGEGKKSTNSSSSTNWRKLKLLE